MLQINDSSVTTLYRGQLVMSGPQDIRPRVVVLDRGEDGGHAKMHQAGELIAMSPLQVADDLFTDQRAISFLGWGGALCLGAVAWISIFAMLY